MEKPTPEEVKRASDALMEVLKVAPVIPFDERGVEHKGKCTCGGTITAIRSTYNGHYHASCDKCGWRMME